VSKPVRIAFVVEGSTDYIVLRAAIRSLLKGRDFVPTNIWPELDTNLRPVTGGGWGAVYKWCLDIVEQAGGPARENPLFALNNVDMVVNADTITIKSPGGPIAPITLEQMRSFTAPMKSRNPVLHYVFARMGMAEEQGFGLTSLKQQAEKLGLPLPSYSMEGDSLVLTIYRSKAAATATLGTILEELTDEEQEGWKFVAGRTGTTQSEYARNLGVTARTAQRHLSHFVELGLLRRVGRGPATKYLKPEFLRP